MAVTWPLHGRHIAGRHMAVAWQAWLYSKAREDLLVKLQPLLYAADAYTAARFESAWSSHLKADLHRLANHLITT